MSEVEQDLLTHLPEGRDPDVAWLLAAAPQERVQTYLYGHAIIVSASESPEMTLVVVCGRPGRSEASWVASEQAARLRSGLIWVSEHPTYARVYAEAERLLQEAAQ